MKFEPDSPGIIFLSRGRLNNGNNYWAYLLVPPEKVEAYIEASIKKALTLQDYGEIIRWGEDKEPPQEVKDEMAEIYGTSENFVKDFISYMEKSRPGKDFLDMLKSQMVKAKKD